VMAVTPIAHSGKSGPCHQVASYSTVTVNFAAAESFCASVKDGLSAHRNANSVVGDTEEQGHGTFKPIHCG
jgi:hypothetical protein